MRGQDSTHYLSMKSAYELLDRPALDPLPPFVAEAGAADAAGVKALAAGESIGLSLSFPLLFVSRNPPRTPTPT